jgi:hypothetical protein
MLSRSPILSESHVARLAEHFSAGRYDLLAECYSYPLPIYLDGRLTVAPDPRAVWSFFQTLHSCLAARGMPELAGRVLSVELPTRGRFRVWTEWTCFGPGGSRPVMRTVCFNRDEQAAEDAFLTEMLEIDSTDEMPLAQMLRAA